MREEKFGSMQESLEHQQQSQGRMSPGEGRRSYPVSDQFRVLEGYNIYRSEKLIIALVAVEGSFGKDLRLYRWQLRNGSWKVDLCRMSVSDWKWDEISTKVREMLQRHEIK